MEDETKLVVPRRDYANIINLQVPSVWEEFLNEPLPFIAETITGALAVGSNGVMAAGGRIVQAILKGQNFKQWNDEFRRLRNAGKIPDDFAETKYGFQTWVELMTIIDEESPDMDRLEALKAIFFAVNKVGAEDKDRIIAYQLWRITKQLNSGDLLMLKGIHECSAMCGGNSEHQWLTKLITLCNFGVVELAKLHLERLRQLQLVLYAGGPHEPYCITNLGCMIRANISAYETTLMQVKNSSSTS